MKTKKKFADYPTSAGWWWYEHAHSPIETRVFGDKVLVYVRAWLNRTEVSPGWWHGPMTRPEAPKPEK